MTQQIARNTRLAYQQDAHDAQFEYLPDKGTRLAAPALSPEEQQVAAGFETRPDIYAAESANRTPEPDTEPTRPHRQPTTLHPARSGTTFTLATGHHVYIGPDRDGRGPVLALQTPGDKRPVVLARFSNSTGAEHLIGVLAAHIDALTDLSAELARARRGLADAVDMLG